MGIIKFISQKFKGRSVLPKYRLARHSFFKSPQVADSLFEQGYHIANFVSEEQLRQLTQVFNEHHQLNGTDGGAFFGVFSKDIAYRLKVHKAIEKILAPSCYNWLINYRTTVNTFVVKLPGPNSQIPVHQDGAAVDETKYSSINIWIPLQDIGPQNGALYIIPKSHHLFLPYRCASVDPLQRGIEEYMAPYFTPVYIQKGQALFFDSRMFHFSPPNLSNGPRVVVVSRISPIDAGVVTYYKSQHASNRVVEQWSCPDDYLIYSDTYNDNEQPQAGKITGTYSDNFAPLTRKQFDEAAKHLGIEKHNQVSSVFEGGRNFIQEPISQSE